ncbi:MAG: hypothetical protein ACLSAH_10950 [Bilophila wadsworthia]
MAGHSGITQIGEEGNVITMGGIGGELNNGLRAERTEKTRPRWLGFSRLSTPISNTLKVLAGFIPALVTFLYTQEWWVLAWFGAPLWFLITGLRNIPQAILGGGGMWSRSLLRWNDYVSWTRVCDSLLYTGLSVPLLEYFIRVLLLEDGLGLTVKDHQFLVFSIIAGANSIYISLHNIYRGFPKEAIIGNLFRSLLAIPVSVFYNDVLACSCRSSRRPIPVDPRTRRGHHFQDGVGYGGSHHRRPCRLAQQSAAPVLGLRNQIAAPV